MRGEGRGRELGEGPECVSELCEALSGFPGDSVICDGVRSEVGACGEGVEGGVEWCGWTGSG